MNTLVIIGAGGHGRVVADCAEATNQYQNIVFLDDSFPERKKNLHWEIVGKTNSFINYINDTHFIVAFGDNALRSKTLNNLKKTKAIITTLIHPTACISKHTLIGNGIVVFAQAAINIGCSIGDGCIINTAATIDHDCTLQDFVHVSPGANIAGGVTIKKQSWVGIGASIIECVTIAQNTLIASGSTVISSTKENSLYTGVPAVFKKSLPSSTNF